MINKIILCLFLSLIPLFSSPSRSLQQYKDIDKSYEDTQPTPIPPTFNLRIRKTGTATNQKILVKNPECFLENYFIDEYGDCKKNQHEFSINKIGNSEKITKIANSNNELSNWDNIDFITESQLVNPSEPNHVIGSITQYRDKVLYHVISTSNVNQVIPVSRDDYFSGNYYTMARFRDNYWYEFKLLDDTYLNSKYKQTANFDLEQYTATQIDTYDNGNPIYQITTTLSFQMETQINQTTSNIKIIIPKKSLSTLTSTLVTYNATLERETEQFISIPEKIYMYIEISHQETTIKNYKVEINFESTHFQNIFTKYFLTKNDIPFPINFIKELIFGQHKLVTENGIRKMTSDGKPIHLKIDTSGQLSFVNDDGSPLNFSP